MTRSKLGIFFFCLCLAANSFAAKEKGKTYHTTKEAMNDIFQAFINLLPYSASEMKFKDPKAEGYILKNLLKINFAFKNAKHLKTMKVDGFKPSYNVVQEHLNHTVEAFQSKNKLFARTRLKATTHLCISCHTQLKSQNLSSTFKALFRVGIFRKLSNTLLEIDISKRVKVIVVELLIDDRKPVENFGSFL
jgi:hypothetical protein